MPVFTPDAITQAVKDHVDEATYGAEGSTTKCNFYVRDVVESLLATSYPALHAKANGQFDALKAATAEWTASGFAGYPAGAFSAALAAANSGQLVIVAYKNPDPLASGHIAILVPSLAMEQSGAWAMPVPFIAHAGKKNPRNVPEEVDQSVFAALKLSYAFKIAMAPAMEIFTLT